MESKFSLKNHIFASYYKRLAKGLSYFKLHISMQKEFFFKQLLLHLLTINSRHKTIISAINDFYQKSLT